MRNKTFIVFQFNNEGKQESCKIYTEDLRKMLNEAKLSKDTKSIELHLEYGGKKVTIPLKISEVRKLIKQSELQIPIVPSSLSEYLVDLTQNYASNPKQSIEGRDNEIEKAWFYLSQKKRNNVFLVGGADVGKTTIAHEIARQISTNECPKEFYNKRVLMLRPELLLKIKSDFYYEKAIKDILKFIKKNRDKVVIFIDNAIYMKTEEMLISALNFLIATQHIPLIATIREDVFEDYFIDDLVISKYLNYVYIDEPELEEIQPMIKKHILKLQKKYGIKISDEMVKFGIFTSILSDSISENPGNVVNIFEKAFLEAKRKDKEIVDKKCILSCYNSYLKLYNKMDEGEKRKIAYHETGHYIVSKMSEHIKDQKIAFVSILPMMDFLGVNWPYRILGKSAFYDTDYLLDEIAIYLAGRIAEKIITNSNTTGASSDLAMANSVAESMITVYGLVENANMQNRSFVIENQMLKSYLISEKQKQQINDQIRKFLDEGEKRAKKIIDENLDLINIIVEELLKEEILTGEQLTTICDNYKENKEKNTEN